MSNTAAFMASGPIITAWLLWSLRLEPFVATLDPGKGAELTFPRREQGEEWLKPPTVLRSQISHQRRNCTLLLFFSGPPSLFSVQFLCLCTGLLCGPRDILPYSMRCLRMARAKRGLAFC